MFLSVVGFVVGVAVLMTGAVQMITLVAVGGFLMMLGSAYAALTHWRKMAEPDLPDNVHPIGKSKGRSTHPDEAVRLHESDGRPLASPPRRLLKLWCSPAGQPSPGAALAATVRPSRVVDWRRRDPCPQPRPPDPQVGHQRRRPHQRASSRWHGLAGLA